MLLVGDINCIPDIPLRIYNLSSYVENIERVDLLPPTNGELPYRSEKEFDVAYANYIMSNDYVFMELMKIIISLYNGENVYLVVYRSPYYDMVEESLTKFIQVRYSYIAQELYDIDDTLDLNLDATFNTIQGIYNLDQDKERYTRLIAPSLIRSDGEIHYGEVKYD